MSELPAVGTAPLCDGKRSVDEIARDAGLELETARELVTQMYRQALVVERDDDVPVATELFLDHACALAVRQRQAIAARERRSSLDEILQSGSYSRRLAVGFIGEMMHIVRAAASHIGAAIAHTSNEEIQAMLSELLEDEHWHRSLLERALHGAGVDERTIARADPLPATLAVVNAWRHAAASDLLSYATLVAFTESGPEEADDVQRLFERSVEHGVLPEAAWRPYYEHTFGDGQCDHASLARSLAVALGPAPLARRDAVRRTLLLHVETIASMEHAIVDFYGPPDGPVLHSVDWRS